MRLRAFLAVAVAPTPGLRQVLDELRQFGRALRPVAPSQLHVTVKFLGDIPPEDIEPLSRALSPVVSTHPAGHFDLAGLGAFPNVTRPSVVWAGLTPVKPLIDLAASVEEVCRTFGYPVEGRPFRPHLTLARINSRPPAGLRQFIETGKDRQFGEFEASELVLFQSELQQGGPRYTPLAHWPLSRE